MQERENLRGSIPSAAEQLKERQKKIEQDFIASSYSKIKALNADLKILVETQKCKIQEIIKIEESHEFQTEKVRNDCFSNVMQIRENNNISDFKTQFSALVRDIYERINLLNLRLKTNKIDFIDSNINKFNQQIDDVINAIDEYLNSMGDSNYDHKFTQYKKITDCFEELKETYERILCIVDAEVHYANLQKNAGMQFSELPLEIHLVIYNRGLMNCQSMDELKRYVHSYSFINSGFKSIATELAFLKATHRRAEQLIDPSSYTLLELDRAMARNDLLAFRMLVDYTPSKLRKTLINTVKEDKIEFFNMLFDIQSQNNIFQSDDYDALLFDLISCFKYEKKLAIYKLINVAINKILKAEILENPFSEAPIRKPYIPSRQTIQKALLNVIISTQNIIGTEDKFTVFNTLLDFQSKHYEFQAEEYDELLIADVKETRGSLFGSFLDNILKAGEAKGYTPSPKAIQTALCVAIKRNLRDGVIEKLLAFNADDYDKLLELAIKEHNNRVISLIVMHRPSNYKPKPSLINQASEEILRDYAFFDESCFNLLLELDHENNQYESLLELAIKSNKIDAARTLLEKCALHGYKFKQPPSFSELIKIALRSAIARGCEDDFDFLMSNFETASYDDLLGAAVKSGNLNFTHRILQDHFSDFSKLNTTRNAGQGILLKSIEQNNIETFKRFIEFAVDFDELSQAVFRGRNLKMIGVFLEKWKSRIFLPNALEDVFIYFSGTYEDLKSVCKQLLSYGADLNRKSIRDVNSQFPFQSMVEYYIKSVSEGRTPISEDEIIRIQIILEAINQSKQATKIKKQIKNILSKNPTLEQTIPDLYCILKNQLFLSKLIECSSNDENKAIYDVLINEMVNSSMPSSMKELAKLIQRALNAMQMSSIYELPQDLQLKIKAHVGQAWRQFDKVNRYEIDQFNPQQEKFFKDANAQVVRLKSELSSSGKKNIKIKNKVEAWKILRDKVGNSTLDLNPHHIFKSKDADISAAIATIKTPRSFFGSFLRALGLRIKSSEKLFHYDVTAKVSYANKKAEKRAAVIRSKKK